MKNKIKYFILLADKIIGINNDIKENTSVLDIIQNEILIEIDNLMNYHKEHIIFRIINGVKIVTNSIIHFIGILIIFLLISFFHG